VRQQAPQPENPSNIRHIKAKVPAYEDIRNNNPKKREILS
jgi:hypothetical protein